MIYIYIYIYIYVGKRLKDQKQTVFSVVSLRDTKTSHLIWAYRRCSGSSGSPPHSWLAMVNWWFMQAAGPGASPIRPTACIVPDYRISISDTVTFTAGQSHWKYMPRRYICANFEREYRTIVELKGHEVSMICKENCLFSSRAFDRGISARERRLRAREYSLATCQ